MDLQNFMTGNKKTYLFETQRLGFRNWVTDDLEAMTEINTDPEVMEFFPQIQSKKETHEFMERMQKLYADKGFCYFAVEKLDTNEFIGFIGICEQIFEAEFTPCIDIGWRIKRNEWSKGFATEGARGCLEFAFNQLGIDKIVATAPKINLKSEKVMIAIGMQKVMDFKHPKLKGSERLEECVLYEINNS